MKTKPLLQSQKNDVLNRIVMVGLNPVDFEWETRRSDNIDSVWVDALVFKKEETAFYFKFDHAYATSRFGKVSTVRRSIFCPGSDEVSEELAVTDWVSQRGHVDLWLRCLKREVEAPNLWEQLPRYSPRERLFEFSNASTAGFTHSEVEKVIAALDQLTNRIVSEFNLQGQQLAYVRERMDYLKDAARRQSRKDWMLTSIGVLVSVAIDLALSPDKAQLLWGLVRSCFAVVLSLPAP